MSRRKAGVLLRGAGAAAAVLGISLALRQTRREPEPNEQTRFVYRPSPLEELLADLGVWVDKLIGWPNLPTPIGLLVLIGERIRLREKNLYDTETLPKLPQPEPTATDSSYLTQRTLDGTFNDLDVPSMGSAGTRFGRNVPNELTYPDPMPEVMTPNPRVVSRELLTRHAFTPATTLNMLAAAWVQFMTRDWFTHGGGDKSRAWQVPLPSGDTFPQNPMLIPATAADATRPPDAAGAPPTHQNFESAWWDASQIYPADPAVQKQLRSGSGGKLNLSRQGAGEDLLPPGLLSALASRPGWWLGLAMMYTLFTREHNAICDALAAEYPKWSDDELFARARLINAALMAKIHTVEWTPAIVSHPTTAYALRAQWFGVQGERLRTTFGRLTGDEVISGVPGSPTNHHSAPYSLTEEFVAVYRMHPLIRDEYSFRATATDAAIENRGFEQITDVQANELLQAIPTQDLFYSFGTHYPGALQLHNYPRFLQHFTRPDKIIVDLASIDVMRMRELGVPRYALFRELMHMRPVRSFEDLTTNAQWAHQMREVYEGRLDRLDLMIGMFAEPKPMGFGFSDTAFRVFILMASRRLKSDRFFTRDFTPEVYTPLGMTWVNNTSMIDVLVRHYPELRPSMHGLNNAFVPWVGTR